MVLSYNSPHYSRAGRQSQGHRKVILAGVFERSVGDISFKNDLTTICPQRRKRKGLNTPGVHTLLLGGCTRRGKAPTGVIICWNRRQFGLMLIGKIRASPCVFDCYARTLTAYSAKSSISIATRRKQSTIGRHGGQHVAARLDDFAANCDFNGGYTDPDDPCADEALLILRHHFSALKQS